MTPFRALLALSFAAGSLICSSAQAQPPAVSHYTAAQLSDTFDSCRHLFPAGKPPNVAAMAPKWKARGLCSNSFAVLYSGLSKTPLLVVERLTRDSVIAAQGQERTDNFYADPRIPKSERAEVKDFDGPMDRGHLSPAANQVDEEGMAQSFALSNTVLQAERNNRVTWRKLETATRKYAKRAKGAVYVFSGPLFNGEPRTVGKNRVWVPSHLFKLVYDESSGRSWAHVLANTNEAVIEPPIDLQEFERVSGWKLL